MGVRLSGARTRVDGEMRRRIISWNVRSVNKQHYRKSQPSSFHAFPFPSLNFKSAEISPGEVESSNCLASKVSTPRDASTKLWLASSSSPCEANSRTWWTRLSRVRRKASPRLLVYSTPPASSLRNGCYPSLTPVLPVRCQSSLTNCQWLGLWLGPPRLPRPELDISPRESQAKRGCGCFTVAICTIHVRRIRGVSIIYPLPTRSIVHAGCGADPAI
ncbi:hypothetical protein F5Y08DRAFT_277980 [Xylaria arbuscula]|nr:hypothetical protein F5Y08DRAFT_277980 [Xylaria arbuscula]